MLVKNEDQTKMEEGEYFAIETFGSTGRGRIVEGVSFLPRCIGCGAEKIRAKSRIMQSGWMHRMCHCGRSQLLIAATHF